MQNGNYLDKKFLNYFSWWFLCVGSISMSRYDEKEEESPEHVYCHCRVYVITKLTVYGKLQAD